MLQIAYVLNYCQQFLQFNSFFWSFSCILNVAFHSTQRWLHHPFWFSYNKVSSNTAGFSVSFCFHLPSWATKTHVVMFNWIPFCSQTWRKQNIAGVLFLQFSAAGVTSLRWHFPYPRQAGQSLLLSYAWTPRLDFLIKELNNMAANYYNLKFPSL